MNRKIARKKLLEKLDEYLNGKQSKIGMKQQKLINKRQKSKVKNRSRQKKKLLEKQKRKQEQEQEQQSNDDDYFY